MSQCLLTTLPDACTDTTIRKLGELRVNVLAVSGESANSREIALKVSQAVTVTANGSGFFTQSKGTASVGTSVSVPADAATHRCYPGNANFTLSISNKYAVTDLAFGNQALGTKNDNLALDLSEMRYTSALKTFYAQFNRCTSGDIANFRESVALTDLWIDDPYGHTYGDLSALANFPNLSVLYLYFMSGKLSGNLSAFAPLTKLTRIGIACQLGGVVTGGIVAGNLSSLSALTSLRWLDLGGQSKIIGNLSSLYNCVNLESLKIPYTGITGDLAALRQRCAKLTTVDVTGTSVTGS